MLPDFPGTLAVWQRLAFSLARFIPVELSFFAEGSLLELSCEFSNNSGILVALV